MNTITVGRTTYKVETLTVDTDGPIKTAYMLHGPRGAMIGLLRNINHPHMLFTINARSFTATCGQLEGKWFTDKNGTLEMAG